MIFLALAAVGSATALALAGVFPLASIITALATALALAGVFPLAGVGVVIRNRVESRSG